MQAHLGLDWPPSSFPACWEREPPFLYRGCRLSPTLSVLPPQEECDCYGIHPRKARLAFVYFERSYSCGKLQNARFCGNSQERHKRQRRRLYLRFRGTKSLVEEYRVTRPGR